MSSTLSQGKLKTSFFFKFGLFILLQTSYASSFKKVEASALPFNILDTNNKRVVDVGHGGKFPVTPLVLEHALRPPTNLYTADAPHTAPVLSVEKITGENASTEIYHIVFDHGRFLPHWEGQVFGVMPALKNPFDIGNSSNIRYFSAASSRYGDTFNGITASLCVSLVVGSTSEVLCKSKPGDKFQFTGPSGEAMLLGDRNNPKATHIFIATTTGIAPFRAHLRRFFNEDIPTYKFSGYAWLFYGVSNNDSVLYRDEFEQYEKNYPENFRYDIALTSGEEYVQDIVAEYASEVFELLMKGAYIYLSGTKKMVTPIETALNNTASSNGKDWDEILAMLKMNNQWRVSVY
ncbi:ferredoxin--NADP reductase, embryo isozyme, chloroplastic-like [Humulus lupulus]|uniref:ferredoxin--NADP reductase, embryo isozyme, chloroplastic-like n=1 Tax=Humulus lupulus TaxID=3486 RepID=UPI002B413B8C|nr:ferredoxin--NADP reductase, embryo isozyme, chloroplastic-like [Humulus lupulus]